MLGTLEYCTYQTPCGWCYKFDKKCDKKIGSVQYDTVDCNHKWEPTNSGGAYVGLDGVSRVYTNYRCKYCGKEEQL